MSTCLHMPHKNGLQFTFVKLNISFVNNVLLTESFSTERGYEGHFKLPGLRK